MKLPRVHRVTKGGKLYKYHRVTRAELPSDIPEDHPSFMAAWIAEEGKKIERKPKTGTIAGACEAYLGSGVFRDLSDSYRPVIRRHVDAIRAQGDDALLEDLRSSHVEADLDPLTPAVARSRLKAWRKLGEFWKKRGLIETDCTRTVRGKRMPKTEGHKEWTFEDLKAFRKHWAIGTGQRRALELLQWTGARCIDVVRIGPGMIDRDGLLCYRQIKTKAEALVPWTTGAFGMERERSDLLAMVADCRHMVFLTTAYGRARSHKAFSSWFSDAATKAGLPHLSAHGLRKYRMNALAEAGVSVLGMQTWVGHLTIEEVELYTRRANRRRAFLPEQVENPVNRPVNL